MQSNAMVVEISLDQRLRWLSVGWAVRYLAEREPDFCVIQHARANHNPARPLVVLVHPGDMIMFADSYDPPAQRAATAAFWGFIGTGTRKELAELREEGADFCVLHRSSSTEFPAFSRFRAVGFHLWKEIKAGHRRGTALYGDDLDAAVQWMSANLLIEERPRIHLCGAYSDPDHGCLTYIGKAFEKIVGPTRITVSPFSPPENAPGMMWCPGARPRPMNVPRELKQLYAKAVREEERLRRAK